MKKLEIIKNVFGGIGLLLLSFHLFTRDSNGQSLQFKNCIRYSSYTFMLISCILAIYIWSKTRKEKS